MFLDDDLYTWSRYEDEDDEEAKPVVLGLNLPGYKATRTGRSAGRVDGDSRRVTYVELQLESLPPIYTASGQQVQPDDLFTAQSNGTTVRVTTVNWDADWWMPGDTRLEVREIG